MKLEYLDNQFFIIRAKSISVKLFSLSREKDLCLISVLFLRCVNASGPKNPIFHTNHMEKSLPAVDSENDSSAFGRLCYFTFVFSFFPGLGCGASSPRHGDLGHAVHLC